MPASANLDVLSSNYLRAQRASDRREAIRLLMEDISIADARRAVVEPFA